MYIHKCIDIHRYFDIHRNVHVERERCICTYIYIYTYRHLYIERESDTHIDESHGFDCSSLICSTTKVSLIHFQMHEI